ncbi:MAG: sugar dehydrogenase [Pseudomonadota bacterium]
MTPVWLTVAFVVAVAPVSLAKAPPEPELDAHLLTIGQYRLPVRIPRGYRLEVLNVELKRPRMLTFAPDGSLWAGSSAGVIYRLEPPYHTASVVAELPDYPHSVAFRGDWVYAATTGALLRTRWADRPLASFETVAELPGGRGHNSRTVGVGPDGRIYLSLGISGNCSDEWLDDSYPEARRRGGVMVLDETASPVRWRGFASGLRNPVGFDWQPGTGVMYASNNGPDHLGFEQPAEQFARLEADSFHGMPWFQWIDGKAMPDACIGQPAPRPATDVVPPAATFPARSAPLGVAFAGEKDLGGQLADDAVVAIHGSWGTAPDGDPAGDPASRRVPRLARVRFTDGVAVRVDTLVDGFQLSDGRRWARPAGVAFGPDGALYFSSDGGIHGLFRLSRR